MNNIRLPVWVGVLLAAVDSVVCVVMDGVVDVVVEVVVVDVTIVGLVVLVVVVGVAIVFTEFK